MTQICPNSSNVPEMSTLSNQIEGTQKNQNRSQVPSVFKISEKKTKLLWNDLIFCLTKPKNLGGSAGKSTSLNFFVGMALRIAHTLQTEIGPKKHRKKLHLAIDKSSKRNIGNFELLLFDLAKW